MSYFYGDIDTSEEALQQDQELMEAVETLVETAAVSVWSSFLEDVHDLRDYLRGIFEYLFPVLMDYREGTASVREDLERLLLALGMVLLTVLILRPWGQFSSSKPSLLKKPTRRHASTPVFSFDDEDEEQYERQTDEERFADMYLPISQSKYRRLVLPPSCKRVDKPRRPMTKVSPKVAAATADTTPRAVDDDDDNPAQRLQTYFQNVRLFLRSMLTFDYTGAGYTLLQWLQGIHRHRAKQKQQLTAADEDQSQGDDGSVHPSLVSPTSAPVENKQIHPSTSADTEDDILLLQDPTDDARNGSVGEEKKDPSENAMDDLSTVPDTPERMNLDHSQRLASDMSVEYFDLEFPSESVPSSKATSPTRLRPETDTVESSKSLTPMRPQPDTEVDVPPPATPPKRPTQDSMPEESGDENSGNKDQTDSGEGDFPMRSISSYASDATPPVTNRTGQREASAVPAEFQSPGRDSFFFETAHTTDSLKRFELEFSLPDKNGYIVGDDFLPDANNCTPLLVFVNSRSGPQQGQLLITQLRRLLNPIQVWDLADGSPEPILESFCVMKNLRILVCGGDGTVSWIVSALEKLMLKRKWPPIAICPLGTGNDLARIHGWGGGYNNESLIGILEQVSESYISLLDRWEVTIDRKKRSETKTFFNYLGVGADAQAALQVHYLRESRPDWFFSRVVNKAWYGIFGAEDLIKASSVHVRQAITLYADGVEIPLPHDSQGIIVLNIDSYAGGVPLWSHGVKMRVDANPLAPPTVLRRTKSLSAMSAAAAPTPSMERTDSVDDLASLTEEERYSSVTACDRPSSCQDGVLDIVSIRGAFHLGQIKVGLSHAERLCQCREVVIKISKKVAVQIDGEPWRQSTCTLRIKRKPDPAVMLHRSLDDGGVETEMSKLLDWAEERSLIDTSVHGMLMKEFSRRIESKIRQRRELEARRNPFRNLTRAIGSSAALQTHSGLSFGSSLQ